MATSWEQQRRSAGASPVSAAVLGQSSASSREQLQSSSSTTPQVQPHQWEGCRGPPFPCDEDAPGMLDTLHWQKELLRPKLPDSSFQRPGSVRSPKGVSAPRMAHLRLHCLGTPALYDGDAPGMLDTLHWQKELMQEEGSFNKDDFALSSISPCGTLSQGLAQPSSLWQNLGSTSLNCLPLPRPRSSLPYYSKKEPILWGQTPRLLPPAPSMSHPHFWPKGKLSSGRLSDGDSGDN